MSIPTFGLWLTAAYVVEERTGLAVRRKRQAFLSQFLLKDKKPGRSLGCLKARQTYTSVEHIQVLGLDVIL